MLEAIDSLLPEVERAVLTGEVAESIVASTRAAVRVGVDGWLDDDLAIIAPWGFELDEITVPISLWQGTADLMVPFSHGAWLADHLPTARLHLEQGEGHLSVSVGAMDAMYDELVAIARADTSARLE